MRRARPDAPVLRTVSDEPATDTAATDVAASWSLRAELLFLTVLAAFLLRPVVSDLLDAPALQTWGTIFVSIAVQAIPFLVLGVLVSGAITAFVPPSVFTRILPRSPALAVPVAGGAGVLLPGCECGAVPVAGGLIGRGVAPAAAFAFLLSAPAINPIVLVATAVAFPGQPEFVLARFVASLATAIIMGLLWVRFGNERWLRIQRRPDAVAGSRWPTFYDTASHDFLHAGGFLVLGAITFGRSFAVRFAPATLVVAVGMSALIAWWLL